MFFIDKMITGYIKISRKQKTFILITFFAFVVLLLQYLQLNEDISIQIPKSQVQRFIINNSHRYIGGCREIIKHKPWAIKKAFDTMERFPKRIISPKEYKEFTNNCQEFKINRGYITKALSKNEEEFPLAFSINIYKDIEQFERLLRAIYRPQNYYCIHIDKKSPNIFHRAVKKISNCFSNVFVASKIIEVTWGEFSVLETAIICMKDLLLRSKKWKYFINLTGQEFPLKTNNELVDNLQKLKGRSIVNGKQPPIDRYFYI